jgi:hypothetical protein
MAISLDLADLTGQCSEVLPQNETVIMRGFEAVGDAPFFWTILSEKISLFQPYGFMVYAACPPGG